MKYKNIIIKSERGDLSAEIFNGWTMLLDGEGHTVVLGKYPNARFEVLEKLIKEVKKMR